MSPILGRDRRHGFTLIELLVVLSIIALLISILLPALRTARHAAQAMRTISGARQLMTAHTVYQNEHNGHVIWSFPPYSINGVPVSITLRSGDVISGYQARRYPIRLIPYLENQWPLLWDHADGIPEAPKAGDSPPEVFSKVVALGTNPAFGINSVFVGGDAEDAGFDAGAGAPNYGQHVVYRNHEVRDPSQLIVFTETSEYRQGAIKPQLGFHRASPPRTKVNRWRAQGDRFEVEDAGATLGVPQGRYLNRTAAAFFDGHAAAKSAADLDDMRLWANRADGPDYDYTHP